MRILVVEDEHRIANSIKKGLEQERYAVDVAYDGEAGYDLASSEAYDAVILDLMLPKLDGLAVCRKLRDEGKHVPVLVLTAKDLVRDKVAGLDSGADDYLTKPFAFEELLARIRALVRRPPVVEATRLRVEDLELDPVSFEVKRGEINLNLSSKEFALLDYLMRNAGKILTKEQIVEHVWDYDADILPNTVEVYIRNLRTKIDLPFGKKKQLISTVRGFGYKLEGENRV